MDPVKKIKDHIIQLNSVSYDDETKLELYFLHLKDTLQHIFGEHSQYVTYLGAIHFRPLSPAASAEECVRSWARGKKQIRDLLCVILEDPTLREYESWDEREFRREDAAVEVAAAERIVADADRRVGAGAREEIRSSLSDVIRAFKNKVRVDMASAQEVHGRCFSDGLFDRAGEISRIRIDLHNADVLEDGVETYLVHRSSFLPKNIAKKVLFLPSSNRLLNQKIEKFFNSAEARLVELGDGYFSGEGVAGREGGEAQDTMAIVALSADCQMPIIQEGCAAAGCWPSPETCFRMGYLVSRLGARRVIALYEESPEFRRPRGYFELAYIPVSSAGAWRSDLLRCLKENRISVREVLDQSFYRG